MDKTIDDLLAAEAVTADDFWEKFFTADGLKEVYQNKLLPQG